MPVKPLTTQSLNALCTRIDFARNGVIHSITPLSATSIEIRFSVQDQARGFDWIDIVFRVDGVSDAKLVSDNILSSLDMSEGITVEHNGIAIGNYTGRLNEAPVYVIGASIGYIELPYGS